MKKVLILLLSMIFILNFALAQVAPITSEPYTDEEADFIIYPPVGWTLRTEGNPLNTRVVILGPIENDFATNIGVYVTNAQDVKEEEFYTEEYANEMIKEAETQLSYLYESPKIRNKGFITVNGMNALNIEISGKYLGLSLKQNQVIILNSGRLYVITYSSLENTYEKYLPIFNEVLDSFTILE